MCLLVASRPDSAMKRNGLDLLEAVGALAHRRRGPEGLVRGARLRAQLELLEHLDDDDVPAAHRHDDQDDQRALGDPVAAAPQRLEAVRVLDDFRRLLGGRSRAGRGARRGAAAGAGAGAAAGAGGAGGLAGWASAVAAARHTAASSAGKRIIFNMVSPGKKCCPETCSSCRLDATARRRAARPAAPSTNASTGTAAGRGTVAPTRGADAARPEVAAHSPQATARATLTPAASVPAAKGRHCTTASPAVERPPLAIRAKTQFAPVERRAPAGRLPLAGDPARQRARPKNGAGRNLPRRSADHRARDERARRRVHHFIE